MQVLKGLVKLGLRTEVTAAALLDAAQGLHDAAEPAEEHIARAAALLHQLNTFAAQGEPVAFSLLCLLSVLLTGSTL